MSLKSIITSFDGVETFGDSIGCLNLGVLPEVEKIDYLIYGKKQQQYNISFSNYLKKTHPKSNLKLNIHKYSKKFLYTRRKRSNHKSVHDHTKDNKEHQKNIYKFVKQILVPHAKYQIYVCKYYISTKII